MGEGGYLWERKSVWEKTFTPDVTFVAGVIAATDAFVLGEDIPTLVSQRRHSKATAGSAGSYTMTHWMVCSPRLNLGPSRLPTIELQSQTAAGATSDASGRLRESREYFQFSPSPANDRIGGQRTDTLQDLKKKLESGHVRKGTLFGHHQTTGFSVCRQWVKTQGGAEVSRIRFQKLHRTWFLEG